MENTTTFTKFKIADLPSLLVTTYKAWDAENPFRLSAVVAYYAILSMPGLLVIIVNLVGSIWGQEIVQGELTNEISSALGRDAASAIETMIAETQEGDKNLISTIIGIGTLIFGASGVFYHLQLSLNQIWRIDSAPQQTFWRMLINRARSFTFILVLGFLLLISFIVTTGISALTNFLSRNFQDIVVYIAYFLDILLSLSMITVLFALMFKYLPNAKIKWKTVWIGAMITAVLFVLGKFLMGMYFGRADFDSTYGTAGTIVLILLWVSYSCLILFFGAEFTYIYAEKYGYGIEATRHSKAIGKE
ncbi:YihY/virulence factor BrkB family protein [Aureibaculum sp. 2210JD6-5]|uniref:YihY/virulence factor BrkB family protein n=1 Tax=Aureibaculum sp. 2210JD6-5 TaxID=3103957 RepID=UPI002AAC6EEE|nr:YihY/virulence factor BrkB family protein [Aureibaculum sp. 2210JD6-5]MDY7394965.1 YihY/virulence factor BrkB family protein [Aureibaculum sp. 2210JD6-5]